MHADQVPHSPPVPDHAVAGRTLRESGIRFLLVGGGNTALGYCTFRLALRALGDRPAAAGLAQAVAYAIGICVSYVLNRRWTFDAGDAHGRAVPRFFAAQLLALALSTSLIQLGVLGLGLRPTISWVLATGVVTVVNFTSQRFWVFRRPAVVDSHA